MAFFFIDRMTLWLVCRVTCRADSVSSRHRFGDGLEMKQAERYARPVRGFVATRRRPASQSATYFFLAGLAPSLALVDFAGALALVSSFFGALLAISLAPSINGVQFKIRAEIGTLGNFGKLWLMGEVLINP